MLKILGRFCFTILVLLYFSTVGRASEPDPAAPFSIDSLVVTVGATHNPGDTVHLVVYFRANITGPSSLHFHFPNVVAPPNRAFGETQRDSSITVDSGYTYSYSIPMKLFSYGSSIIETSVFTADPHLGYSNLAYDYVHIEHTATQFVFTTSHSPSRSDAVSYAIESTGGGGGSFHISGSVMYEDLSQPDSIDMRKHRMKGVYGDTVIAVFTKADISGGLNPDSIPPLYFPMDCSEGLAYGVCDVNGHFQLDCTNGPSVWSAYTNVILLVSTGNAATHVSSDSTGNGYYSIPTWTFAPIGSACSWRPMKVFAPPHCYIHHIVNPTSIITFTADSSIILNSPEGAVLRNMEFCREFDSIRPIGVIPP